MALLNYLASGTYTIVDAVYYSKQASFLRFIIKIFADDSKTTELGSRPCDVSAATTYQGLLSTLTAPPEGYQVGDAYVVGVGATGPWEGRDKLIAVCRATDEWSFWGLAANQTFYDLIEENYFTLDINTLERTRVYPMNDTRVWATWFPPELIFSETSNLYKQCYLFLKSLPGFENVIDG